MILIYFLIISIIFGLGLLVLFQRKRKLSNIVYFLSTLGVLSWVIGNLMMFHSQNFLFWNRFAYFGATWVAYFILILLLVFPRKLELFKVNNLFLFTLPAIMLSVFSFTDFIVREMPSVDEVIFGFGNTLWGIYFLFYVGFAFFIATRNQKKYDEQDKYQLQYVLLGLYSFFIFALSTNLLMPALGYPELYRIGPLFSVLYIGFTGYAILKHRLLNVSLALKKSGTNLITLTIVTLSLLLTNFLLNTYSPTTNKLHILSLLTIFWALAGQSIAKGLITGAKHAFVKGYYNQENLFKDLALQIKNETNKEKIFQTLESVMDKWIKFESTAIIIPNRDEDDIVSNYELRYQIYDTTIHTVKLDLDNPILAYFNDDQEMRRIGELDESISGFYKKLGFDPKTLFIPFRSREMLEGILIVGERSGGYKLRDEDLAFFESIILAINSVLFGLTPLEKLEAKYMKTLQKLHDAEVQLLRSEKNEDISFHHVQMAHEVRTAASIIKMATEDLPDSAELEENKKAILRANENNVFIANKTLELQQNKAEAAQMSPVDMVAIVERSLEIVDTKKFEIKKTLQAVPVVNGVAGELQIAITNLLTNAVEAMGEEGVLSVRTYLKGPNVTVEIQDTGKGIPKSQQVKIWQPYIAGEQTAGQGNVGHSGGRGWGLTIVNKIVTDHNGAVKFKSEEGVGTTFTLRLPVAS